MRGVAVRIVSVFALAGAGLIGPAQERTALAQAADTSATRARLPADFAVAFQLYDKVDKPERKIVRYLYVNREALAGARPGTPFADGTTIVMADHAVALDTAGKPLKNPDGRLAATGRLTGIAVMTKQPLWGDTNPFPPEKDNGDWEYASFKADGTANPIKLDACYACHLPQKGLDYVFSAQKIHDAARK